MRRYSENPIPKRCPTIFSKSDECSFHQKHLEHLPFVLSIIDMNIVFAILIHATTRSAAHNAQETGSFVPRSSNLQFIPMALMLFLS